MPKTSSAERRAKLAIASATLNLPAQQVQTYFGQPSNPIWMLEHVANLYDPDFRAAALEDEALASSDEFAGLSQGQIDARYDLAQSAALTLKASINSPLMEKCWQVPGEGFLGNQVILPAGDVNGRYFEFYLDDYPLPHPFDGTVPLSIAELVAFDPAEKSRSHPDPFAAACHLIRHTLTKAAVQHAGSFAQIA